MVYALKYFDEVETDILEAVLWYREQNNGLEIKFINAIEIAINSILKHPKNYTIRYKNVRIAHPKIFPFNINYYLDDVYNTVVVIAIVHNKRNPAITKKRKY